LLSPLLRSNPIRRHTIVKIRQSRTLIYVFWQQFPLLLELFSKSVRSIQQLKSEFDDHALDVFLGNLHIYALIFPPQIYTLFYSWFPVLAVMFQNHFVISFAFLATLPLLFF